MQFQPQFQWHFSHRNRKINSKILYGTTQNSPNNLEIKEKIWRHHTSDFRLLLQSDSV